MIHASPLPPLLLRLLLPLHLDRQEQEQSANKADHMRRIERDRGSLYRGATGGGAPPLAFHTLAKDMSLNRGASHFTLGLRPLSRPSFYKYTCAPLSKLPSCAPVIVTNSWRPNMLLSIWIMCSGPFFDACYNDSFRFKHLHQFSFGYSLYSLIFVSCTWYIPFKFYLF